MANCLSCKQSLKADTRIYCSNKCQRDYQYSQFIVKWKNNEINGTRGIHAKNLSSHLRRYLMRKYNEACSLCGWNQENPITGKVPLEVDHLDGNAENNRESNLRLLCPNCHSLTPNFKNLNRGLGRTWRRLKYIKG